MVLIGWTAYCMMHINSEIMEHTLRVVTRFCSQSSISLLVLLKCKLFETGMLKFTFSTSTFIYIERPVIRK